MSYRSSSKLLAVCVVALSTIGFASVGQAVTFSFVGGDFTTHDAWRTTSAIKTLDGDLDNVYGTDGYLLFNSGIGAAGTVQPSYATGTNVAPSQFGPSGTYVPIDNPTIAPGPGPIANTNTGTAFGSTTETDFAEITVVQAGNFRIGVLQDNHDFAAISPASLRIRQTVGGLADTGQIATLLDRDLDGDWYFFDAINAAVGDVYRISGINDTGHPSNGIGGITFDRVTVAQQVPEPASLALWTLIGLSLAGFAWYRRRK